LKYPVNLDVEKNDKSIEDRVRLNAKMSNSYSSEGEGNSGNHRAEQIRHSWQNSWQSSWQSIQEIEDELRTQLLREVKTEVDNIL
jgi:hypothetical protein